MLNNPDGVVGQTADTASRAFDYALLLVIDLLALIAQVNERAAGIIPIGTEPPVIRFRPFLTKLVTVWAAL